MAASANASDMAGSQAAAQNAMKQSKSSDTAFSQDADTVSNEYPKKLLHANILVAAKKYTDKQIAERETKICRQNGSSKVVNTNTIVHRIKTACEGMAKQKGIPPDAFRREFDLQRPQSESGLLPYSLRNFKGMLSKYPPDPHSFKDLDDCRKKLKTQGYPLEFDVKIYLVCQKYMKDNDKSFEEAVDEACRVYGFKNRNSAVHLLKDAESNALDREGNIVNWKVYEDLVEGDKKSKSLEFYAKREARARDANAKASPGPTPVAAIPSRAQAQAPRALNSSHEAVQTSFQDPKTQSRPKIFKFAAIPGVFGRPTPSTRLASHVNPQPLPTFLQQNAPFEGQPAFLHPGKDINISGAPQTNGLSYAFPTPMLEAHPHDQYQPQHTVSLQEQRAQSQGYVPMGGFYNGTLPSTLSPAAITTAKYSATQPAFTFRRHETNPMSTTSARIPNVPTPSGAIVSPSVLHDASSEDVQLRDAPATHVGRDLPGKTVYGKRIISADLLGYQLMAFLKVLDDPDHIHNEDFDFNTFAHIITVDEASDLQETVKDITDFHKHLETKTGDLRSRYTDEQIRKVAANAVRHFMDSEYEKGAYFIKYFLNVLAKFDELVELAGAHEKESQEESEGKSRDGDEEKREDEGGLSPQKVADSMDIDDAGEVDAGENGSGGADEQNEDAVGGDDGADPMEIDEA